MRDPERIFQDARAILQSDKTSSNWKSLLKLLDDKAVETDHFKLEFEPAILASLDRDWPDLVRVVGRDHTARVRKYGRVYAMKRPWAHSGTIFKKTVGEMTADIKKGVPKGHYSGLYFYRIDGLPNLMLEALLATGRVGALEHFHLEEVQQWNTYARYNGPEDQVGAMLDAVFDRDAANLVTFGVHGSDRQTEGNWERFIARRGELTSLERVAIDTSRLPRVAPYLEDLSLVEFHLTGFSRAPDLDALFAYPFAQRIERFKCHWSEGQSDFERWLRGNVAPNMRDWCVTKSPGLFEAGLCFDMTKAAFWRDRLEGKPQTSLDARVVYIPSLDDETLRAQLFDGGRLIPSERMEVLSVGSMRESDAIALIEQAPEAWPNLTALYLGNEFYYSTPGWDVINESTLVDRLEFFDWGSHSSFNTSFIADALANRRASMKEFRESVAPFVEEIQEPRWRPILWLRLAFAVMHHVRTRPRMNALAKMLGMTVTKGDDTYAIERKLKAFLIERFEAFTEEPSPFLGACPDRVAMKRSGPM